MEAIAEELFVLVYGGLLVPTNARQGIVMMKRARIAKMLRYRFMISVLSFFRVFSPLRQYFYRGTVDNMICPINKKNASIVNFVLHVLRFCIIKKIILQKN